MKKLLLLAALLATLASAHALPNCDPIRLRIYHGTNGLTICVRITNSFCCGIRTLVLMRQQHDGAWHATATNELAVCTEWTAAFTIEPNYPNARYRTVQIP